MAEKAKTILFQKDGKIQEVDIPPSGLMTFMGWNRLAKNLTTVELTKNERIIGFTIRENGLDIHLENIT